MRPFQIVEDLGFTNASQVLLNLGARYGRGIHGKVKAEKILPCANTIK